MAVQIITDGDLGYGGAVFQTSGGTWVAVLYTPSGIEAWKDLDGTPSQIGSTQSASTVHGGGNFGHIAAVIDSTDVVHVVSSPTTEQTRDIAYNTISDPDGTPAWGTWEQAADFTENVATVAYWGCDIDVDGNDKPHILYIDHIKDKGTTYRQISYVEKTGASWSSPALVSGTANQAYDRPTFIVGPDVSSNPAGAALYFNVNSYDITHKVFTSSGWGTEFYYTITANGALPGWPGIVYQSEYKRYHSDPDDSDQIYENNTDLNISPHTTYSVPSAWSDGTNRYLFVIDTGSDVHLWSNTGSGWTDEGDLQTLSDGREVITDYQYRNQNYASTGIGYIYSDTTTIYFDTYSLGPAEKTGSVTADAAIEKAQSGSVTANAAIEKSLSGSITADASLVKTTSDSVTSDATIFKVQSGSVPADAVIQREDTGSFSADALIVNTISDSITADATLLAEQTGSVTADATIFAEQTDSATADAAIERERTGSITADAIIEKPISDSTTADATIKKAQSGSITANAAIETAKSGSVTADATIESGGLSVSDDFEAYSASTKLSAQTNWTAVTNDFDIVDNSGDKVIQPDTSGQEVCVRWNADTPNANQWIELKLDALVSGSFSGPAGRASSSATDYYALYADSGSVYLGRVIGGSWTTLDSNLSFSISGGDVLRLEIEGTGATVTLTCKKNGSPITAIGTNGVYSDTHANRITSANFLAVTGYNNTATYGDEWAGGNLGGAEEKTGSVTADAAIEAEQTDSVTANAAIEVSKSNSVTANAIVERSESDSFTADANIKATPTGSVTADAAIETEQTDSVTTDAVIEKEQTGSVTTDAVIESGKTDSITSDATIFKEQTGSVAANAAIQASKTDSITADATIETEETGSITSDGVIEAEQTGSVTSDATIEKEQTGNFSADADIAGAGEKTGSITADATIEKAQSDSISANAVVEKGVSQSVTANAAIIAEQTSGITTDSVIEKTFSSSVIADATIFVNQTGSITADATIVGEISDSITADAAVEKEASDSVVANATIISGQSGSVTVDADITCVGKPEWVSPPDAGSTDSTPVLVFTIPWAATNIHFRLEIDTVATFDSGNYQKFETYVSQTNWEYNDGGGWQPFPAGGVSNIYAGNQCRYSMSTPLATGTWYRAVRGALA